VYRERDLNEETLGSSQRTLAVQWENRCLREWCEGVQWSDCYFTKKM